MNTLSNILLAAAVSTGSAANATDTAPAPNTNDRTAYVNVINQPPRLKVIFEAPPITQEGFFSSQRTSIHLIELEEIEPDYEAAKASGQEVIAGQINMIGGSYAVIALGKKVVNTYIEQSICKTHIAKTTVQCETSRYKIEALNRPAAEPSVVPR